jgi:hypothetical protein
MNAAGSNRDGPNWRRPAGRALEAALNRALALDPDTRDALAGLDGRSVELHLQAPPLALRLTVAGARLQVGPAGADPAQPADLDLRTTLGGPAPVRSVPVGAGIVHRRILAGRPCAPWRWPVAEADPPRRAAGQQLP